MDTTTHPVQLIHQYLNELEQLRFKALSARQSLVESYNYDIVKDYRVTIFEQIDRLIIYHDTNVALFLRYIINPEYVSELFNTSVSDSKRIAIDYLQRTKHALVIFIQSVVESFYRAVCNQLQIKVPFSFAKLVDSMFDYFNFDKDTNWYKANDILSKVRNTIHNNGIHTHSDESVTYHGKQHCFSKNFPHQSAGYETIIQIIGDLVECIYSIGKESSNIKLIDNHGFVDYNKII